MKNLNRVFSIVLLIMIVSIGLTSTIYALEGDVSGLFSGKTGISATGIFATPAQSILSIIKAIGIISAIAMLMLAGIKYFIGGSDEKAKIKESITAYLIGAILLFGAVGLVDTLSKISIADTPTTNNNNNNNNTQGNQGDLVKKD